MNRGLRDEFHLDSRSGVAPYLQLIHQVRHATAGPAAPGDQLPTVKDVPRAGDQPQHVLKAYRELEYQGLWPRGPAAGTFVTGTLKGRLPGRPAGGPAVFF